MVPFVYSIRAGLYTGWEHCAHSSSYSAKWSEATPNPLLAAGEIFFEKYNPLVEIAHMSEGI